MAYRSVLPPFYPHLTHLLANQAIATLQALTASVSIPQHML